MRASVDREGTVLRVTGPNDAAVSSVVALVEGLGYFAQPLGSAPDVARWFGTEDVDELSQEEATVLASRWVDDLAAEGVIDEPGRVAAVLRDWLLGSFRSAARTGTVEMAPIGDASLRTVLDPSEASNVRAWLGRKLIALREA